MSHAPTPPAHAVPAAPGAGRRPSRALFALAGAFFSLVVAAWAWFHLGARTDVAPLRFEVLRDPPGWTFVPEPIAPRAQAMLATTNLLNGAFTAPDGTAITVFAGEWHARDSTQLSVVGHTPDICWVLIGWQPVPAGLPQTVPVALEGGTLPFECRVFATPGGDRRELVLWCTLRGGKVLAEGQRFAIEDQAGLDGATRRSITLRRRTLVNLWRSLTDRIPSTGEKQFVRLSVPVGGDVSAALAQLTGFARRWVSVVTAQLPNGAA